MATCSLPLPSQHPLFKPPFLKKKVDHPQNNFHPDPSLEKRAPGGTVKSKPSHCISLVWRSSNLASRSALPEFTGKYLTLLSHGLCDGFGARDFQAHSNGYVNPLTLIREAQGANETRRSSTSR
jgi:hypothetical protein